MNWHFARSYALLVFITLGRSTPSSAQFFDGFDNLKLDPDNGWLFKAGDGTATMEFRQGGVGYASIFVDGTTDRRGIWWTLIERKVSDKMELIDLPCHQRALGPQSYQMPPIFYVSCSQPGHKA